MLQELFSNYQKTLDLFFEKIDPSRSEEILHAFLKCSGMIIFTGVGKSGIIAEKLAMTMISTGTKALYLPAMNALHGDVGIVSKEDIVVLISKSGESDELVNLVPFIRKKGATIISWVSNPFGKLLKMSDLAICLPFDKELCPYDLAPTTSTAVQLIFGDVLSIALMRAKSFSIDEYALNHPAGSLGRKITLAVKDLMLKGKELPLCKPEDRLSEVIVELSKKKCGCLLIVGKGEKLEGIFTDGDLRRFLEKERPPDLNKKMKELMTISFLYTQPEQRAWDALRFMQKDPNRLVMVMPVLEEEKVIGLIRMHDIIHAGIN
ncbi:MAG: KpsF/GutQ family sugar-phosphate isomerase [Simkania negevensis]|nr:KpsF/GutQ family sugar-phosphate isomerase [Simkania negevensis]